MYRAESSLVMNAEGSGPKLPLRKLRSEHAAGSKDTAFRHIARQWATQVKKWIIAWRLLCARLIGPGVGKWDGPFFSRGQYHARLLRPDGTYEHRLPTEQETAHWRSRDGW
jgi:hypothetical protein